MWEGVWTWWTWLANISGSKTWPLAQPTTQWGPLFAAGPLLEAWFADFLLDSRSTRLIMTYIPNAWSIDDCHELFHFPSENDALHHQQRKQMFIKGLGTMIWDLWGHRTGWLCSKSQRPTGCSKNRGGEQLSKENCLMVINEPDAGHEERLAIAFLSWFKFSNISVWKNHLENLWKCSIPVLFPQKIFETKSFEIYVCVYNLTLQIYICTHMYIQYIVHVYIKYSICNIYVYLQCIYICNIYMHIYMCVCVCLNFLQCWGSNPRPHRMLDKYSILSYVLCPWNLYF
jgi:hypothetical protein